MHTKVFGTSVFLTFDQLRLLEKKLQFRLASSIHLQWQWKQKNGNRGHDIIIHIRFSYDLDSNLIAVSHLGKKVDFCESSDNIFHLSRAIHIQRYYEHIRLFTRTYDCIPLILTLSRCISSGMSYLVVNTRKKSSILVNGGSW